MAMEDHQAYIHRDNLEDVDLVAMYGGNLLYEDGYLLSLSEGPSTVICIAEDYTDVPTNSTLSLELKICASPSSVSPNLASPGHSSCASCPDPNDSDIGDAQSSSDTEEAQSAPPRVVGNAKIYRGMYK